jgi:hypothetical protein
VKTIITANMSERFVTAAPKGATADAFVMIATVHWY